MKWTYTRFWWSCMVANTRTAGRVGGRACTWAQSCRRWRYSGAETCPVYASASPIPSPLSQRSGVKGMQCSDLSQVPPHQVPAPWCCCVRPADPWGPCVHSVLMTWGEEEKRQRGVWSGTAGLQHVHQLLGPCIFLRAVFPMDCRRRSCWTCCKEKR